MATLIKNKRIAPDNWQLLKPAADGAQLGKSPELPVTGDWIVPLAIWTEQRAQLSQRSGRNGVLLENTEDACCAAWAGKASCARWAMCCAISCST